MSRKITKKDLAEFMPGSEAASITPPSATLPIPSSPPPPVPAPALTVTETVTSYAGDAKDNSSPLLSDWKTMDFEDPSELVSTFDPYINEGHVTQHLWQLEVSEMLGHARPTAQKPLRFALCAANGSGKDKYVIAPFAIWFALCKIQSLCIITSSSGNQLTAQTENYIRSLAEAVNKKMGQEYFRVRQRYIRCNLSGSEIRMFATDEAGKAEGYHPVTPVAEMAIIVNEAKSVAPEIFEALSRCTGYNYWLEVSTPGVPSGHFYRSITDSRLGFITRKVTAYDCSHISIEEIERDKVDHGEHSAIFRSKRLAEFTSLEGQIIISLEVIEKCRKNACRLVKAGFKRTGIDIAAGGDENAIYIIDGNVVIAKFFFRETDTTITAMLIAEFLRKHGIEKDDTNIFADDGGVGHAVIDMLDSVHGYVKINRVFNQRRAIDNKMFGNAGAERWYKVARLFEENVIPVPEDELTVKQLTSRFYKQSGTGGRIFLESKADAKAHGRPSPDRADAFVLCYTDMELDALQDSLEVKPTVQPKTAVEIEEIVVWSPDYMNKLQPRGPKGHLFSIESKL